MRLKSDDDNKGGVRYYTMMMIWFGLLFEREKLFIFRDTMGVLLLLDILGYGFDFDQEFAFGLFICFQDFDTQNVQRASLYE